jgi:flagellar biosynthetic protein FliP
VAGIDFATTRSPVVSTAWARYYRGMDTAESFLQVITVLLVCTSFIKIVTVLSVLRFGMGLTGFEFGAVSLVVGFGIAVLAAPPQLTSLGFPAALLAPISSRPPPDAVAAALLPFMRSQIDPAVQRAFPSPPVAEATPTDAEDVASPTAEVSAQQPVLAAAEFRSVAPLFLISQVKSGLLVGCAVLVPFVVVDLLVAHLLTLIGVVNLSAAAVSLPLKMMIFLAVDGWGMLVTKLLGGVK